MKEFEVMISERLERVVTVQAETRADAEEMVSDAWNKEEYVLTADDFQGAEFTADEGRDLTPPTLSVLLVQPEKYPQRIEMPNTLEALQKAVGGMIEAVYPYEDKVALIGNDEGKLNGMPLNRALQDDKHAECDSCRMRRMTVVYKLFCVFIFCFIQRDKPCKLYPVVFRLGLPYGNTKSSKRSCVTFRYISTSSECRIFSLILRFASHVLYHPLPENVRF